MPITVPAMSTFQSVVQRPCKNDNPSGKVIIELSEVMMSGHKKLFQLAMKAKIANVAMAGFAK